MACIRQSLSWKCLSWKELLCFLLVLSYSANACPNTQSCSCEIQNRRVIINCRYKSLTSVPSWNINPDDQFYELNLGENRIKELPARAFNGLAIEKLDLSNNEIQTISNEAFDGLQDVLLTLVLHVKRMTYFPKHALGILAQLEVLHIKGFEITSLPPDAFSSLALRDVRLDECGLNMISSDTFVGLEPSLQSLVLSGNSLSDLPTTSLSSLIQLEVLNIARNRVSKIPGNAFLHNTKLSELDLSNNQIDTVQENAFSGLENCLTILNLQHNLLTNYQLLPIGEALSLNKLNLGYNPLLSIRDGTFSKLSSLVHLNLHSCKLSQLSEGMFQGLGRNLQILLLAENDITSISTGLFLHFKSLVDLNMDLNLNLGNILNPDIFSGLEGVLKTLSLTNVGFTNTVSNWDSIRGLYTLTSLKLRQNNIGIIPDFTLQKMTKLENLDLYDTKMPSISQKALHGPEGSLQGINMGINGISMLSQCVFYGFDVLNQIHLTDNPLHCDCNLRWLRQWIDDRFDEFQILTTDWKCASPANHKNQKFVDLKADDFVCDTVVEAPVCTDITTTTTTTSTTTTTPVPSTTMKEGTEVIPPEQPIKLDATEITSSSVLISWQVLGMQDITSFNLEYRKFGSVGPLGKEDLGANVREFFIEKLESKTDYVICLTIVVISGDETSCTSVRTLEEIPDASEIKGPVDTNIIIGSILGAIAIIILLVIMVFLVLKWRSGSGPFKEHFGAKTESSLPTRTQMPTMGYNSKRFSRARSMDIQNMNNKKIDTKLENFTPQQRDMILNMMTHSGTSHGSTMSMISTGSAMRYVPEPPPRPPNMGGYLNPDHIQDEDPDNHIYSEIPNDNYQEITGSAAMAGAYATGGCQQGGAYGGGAVGGANPIGGVYQGEDYGGGAVGGAVGVVNIPDEHLKECYI